MTARSKSWPQVALHWLAFFLVLLQLGLRGQVDRAFYQGMEEGDLKLTMVVGVHLALGGAILLITLFRLHLRNLRGVPPAMNWRERWADVLFGIVYATLILLPIAGVVAWSFAATKVIAVHHALYAVLLVMWPVYTLWVLADHLIWRSGAIWRMTGGR